MTQFDKLEGALATVFTKKIPFKLPAASSKVIATALWWLVLVGGVLQLYQAWRLWFAWQEMGRVDAGYGPGITVNYGGQRAGVLFFVALLSLFFSAILLLLAAPGLKAERRIGWNLVLYSLLLNVLYGLAVLFTDFGDVFNFLGAVFISVPAAYALFQIQGAFREK